MPDPTAPSAGNIKTLRHTYANRTNAERAAKAEWHRLQRGMATLELTLAYGRADLFPEVPVDVVGWKPKNPATTRPTARRRDAAGRATHRWVKPRAPRLSRPQASR